MHGHKVVLCNVEGNTLRAVMYTALESAGWDVTYLPFFDKPCLDPTLLMAIAHLPDLPITVSALPLIPDSLHPHKGSTQLTLKQPAGG